MTDPATTEIYTLSLHDALPICLVHHMAGHQQRRAARGQLPEEPPQLPAQQGIEPDRRLVEHEQRGDRKSTRLNSSHMSISYAVFCLKKKRKQILELDHVVRNLQ